MLKLEKTVKADREKVFDIFSNYELFAKIIPEYYSSILQRSLRGNVSIVAEHLKLLDEEFVIMTKHIITPYDSHESIVVGGDVKGSYIKENFTTKENGTLLQIEAEIKLKSCKKLMSYAKGKNFDRALDDMMNKLIAIAES